MPNHLADSNSPYLLQHQENPVNWYPWGEEALERARREDKPIFLSIGYAACHWCHVMAHESFEDPKTAEFMKEHFVNIKVDREERPDLDNIYMDAVVAMTGQGGWPMSVFLTPELEPFFGGTYFPPVRRYNMPSFMEVLKGVAHAWQEDRDGIRRSGRQITAQLSNSDLLNKQSAGELSEEILDEAAFRLAQSYDWKFGGWGKAPKFPQPMTIEFLLRRASRDDKFAREVAEHALDAMARGGMYDVVGGGFARYSTDNDWLVPHFEKMLYDNAQLARAYLHGYLVTGDAHYRRVCEETLDFIARELMERREGGSAEHGGFFSSLDADSEGEEGKYYVWTPEEIRAALPERQEAEFILAAYGLTDRGNFEGKNVLQRKLDDEELADQFQMQAEDVPDHLQKLHARLLEAREKRVRPGTDDKVLVSWNGLALIAFAEAARYLERQDYLEIARHNADFLLSELQPDDRLLRSWRKGQAQHNAYLEDYAALILGLLALYQVDPDNWWYNSAVQLADLMVEHFTDPEGGFFDTSDEHGPLLTRPKDVQDNATPSGNALAATALIYLNAFADRGEWRNMAEEMLGKIQKSAERYPTAFGQWLNAYDAAIHPLQEVVIVGELDSAITRSYQEILRSRYLPNTILALTSYPPALNAPPLVKDRPLLEEKPTAYICQNMVCRRPVNSPVPFKEQLEAQ